jgi:hypothetical protein
VYDLSIIDRCIFNTAGMNKLKKLKKKEVLGTSTCKLQITEKAVPQIV